jgi:rRNA maturation RNase YbeY
MIHIQIINAHPKHRIRHTGTIRTARAVVKNEHRGSADIHIVFINDKQMISLNGRFLHHWFTTDVVSFPLGEKKNVIEGEIYINLDQANRQAREYEVSFREEYLRLVIHGVLHLVGYDDKNRNERRCMSEKENIYLSYIK